MPIYQDNRQLLVRLKWLRVLFILAFLALVAKLWHLTILESQRYKELAERNRVQTIPLIAPRGLIYDREGKVLVDNSRSFNLVLFRDEIKDLKETLSFLSKGVDLELEAIKQRLERARHYAPFQPVVLKENISMEEITYIFSHQAEHPEIRAVQQPRRIYRYKELAAHALGYVGEVSEPQLKLPEFEGNKPGDIIGKFGIERTYNRWLTGQDGRRRVLVNSVGKTIQDLGVVNPLAGKELISTLDLDLQTIAEEALAESPGAVIAFDPRSGEVLVMASRPAFDPNQFAVRISREEWERLMGDPDDPFQNRVIQSTFSPGSTFKIVMALAGLEQKAIDPATSVYCNGGALLYGHYFRCWKAGGHGRVALREAIQNSCNVYFYHLGQKLGISQISDFSERLGLGLPTGIDLPGEAMGLVPSEEWKKKRTGQPWYAGETISVAIGQGALSVTPIQLARAVGVLATGDVPTLRLVKDHEPIRFTEVAELPVTHFDSSNLQAIREAMWTVVNQWGTGRAAQVAGFEVCGKTGTAQTVSQSTRAKLSASQAEQFQSNAWFVGFAPRDNPEIVVTIIVQRGGGGGSVAAPVAGKILTRYYEKRKAKPSVLEIAANQNQEEAGSF